MATVRRPSSVAARITRMAISERLATSSFFGAAGRGERAEPGINVGRVLLSPPRAPKAKSWPKAQSGPLFRQSRFHRPQAMRVPDHERMREHPEPPHAPHADDGAVRRHDGEVEWRPETDMPHLGQPIGIPLQITQEF